MTEPGVKPDPRPRVRKRLFVWLIALLTLVIGIFWLIGGFDREPSYKGTRAGNWLDVGPAEAPALWVTRSKTAFGPIRLANSSPPPRPRAISGTGWQYQPRPNPVDRTVDDAFKAMGDKGVIFLIRTMRHKPSRLLVNAVDFLDQHDFPMDDWIEAHLPNPDQITQHRSRAIAVIGDLGPAAAAAIPDLARLFADPGEDDYVRGLAGRALQKMGERAAIVESQVLETLKSTNKELQISSARILGNIGPKAMAAVPALEGIVRTTQSDALAFAGAKALWDINHETNTVIGVCSNLLESVSPDLRCAALAAVAPMPNEAKVLSPAIQSKLQDADDGVRWQAEKTLRRVDPEALENVVHQINQDIPAQVARIVQVLKAQNQSQITGAARALAVIGPDAVSAAPALTEVLDQLTTPGASQVAGAATGSSNLVIRPSPRPRYLAGWTSYPQVANGSSLRFVLVTPETREISLALAEIGPEARVAVPKLIAFLRGPRSPNSSAAVCKALGAIGTQARDAVPVLGELLKPGPVNDPVAAAEALTRIAPEQCSNAIVALRSVTQFGWMPGSPRYPEEAKAATALWRLGLEPKPPVEALIKSCKMDDNSDWYFQEAVLIELLGDIGPEAKSAIPLLRDCLDKDLNLRRAAAIAIRKIDPDEYRRLGLPGTLAIP